MHVKCHDFFIPTIRGVTPLPAFHTFIKVMSSNTFLTLAKAMYYPLLLIKDILAPPSQNYPVAPLPYTTDVFICLI